MLRRREVSENVREVNKYRDLGLCIYGLALVALGATAAWGQTSVILNGSTYTLKDHPRVWLDGPGGALSSALQDTNNRAQSTNPAYQALVNTVNAYVHSNVCSTGPGAYSGYQCPGTGLTNGGDAMSHAVNAAILWWAQGANPADPNGYLAAAKYGLNHIEDASIQSFACDESQYYCNRSGYDMFNVFLFDGIWTAYSIVRDQMTNTERATFASKVLNDNASDHNGINPAGNGCTKQTLTAGAGTITATADTNIVTGLGTHFTSVLSPGMVIFTATPNAEALGTVLSVTSDTQVILTTKAYTTAGAGSAWNYAGAWSDGDCGLVWFLKHHRAAPHLISTQTANYSSDYPLGGGDAFSEDHNITFLAEKTYILIGLALADDDSRAKLLLQQAHDYYRQKTYPILKSGWTPFAQGGASYTPGVWHWGVATVAIALRNSIASGPDYTSGFYISRMPQYIYYSALPNAPWILDNWGDVYAAAQDIQSALRGGLQACYLNPSQVECQYYYNYFRKSRSDYSASGWGYNGGSYLPWLYVFHDFKGAVAAPGPSQYLFRASDLSNAQCVSQFGAGFQCTDNSVWQDAISKSDWSSTASQVLIKAGWDRAGQDHTDAAQQGAYHIYRNGYLLAGDTAGANGTFGSGTVYDSLIDLNKTTIAGGSYAPFSRWASTDPTGDSQSRYAYAMIDLTKIYSAAGQAKRVHRHIVHFKKAGAQDYIISYDDIALSAQIAVAPKAYFHYYLNGIAPGSAISFNAESGTVTNTQVNSRLLTQFVASAGKNTAALGRDNVDGTYANGVGKTYRVYMCPSLDGTTCNNAATAAEWIVVHKPSTSTSDTLPSIIQLTSVNFRTVQVGDAVMPKVVAFAQGGNLYTAISFASTHSGIGQYLIAGLAPGTYTVTKDGSTILSNQTISAGDNTLYFESASGAFSVAQGGQSISPPLSCDLNADGTVNILDVSRAINAALGVIPCTAQYQLDQSGTCTNVTVQRVVAASLGLGCKIGQ